MKIGICDDDGIFMEKMEKNLDALMEETGMSGQVLCFPKTDGLMEYLESGKLDLVFLDVPGQEHSAIETAKTISRLRPECEIAYCSDSLEYVEDAYDTRHCYYLLKGELEERLPRVIDRVVDIRLENRAKVCIYSCGKNEIVPVRNIMYAERSGKKTYVHLADQTLLETPERIDGIEEKLVWPQFVRCHNSFVVSFDKLKTYTRHQLIMEDGREIPVSRPYLVKVRKSFSEWNKKNL